MECIWERLGEYFHGDLLVSWNMHMQPTEDDRRSENGHPETGTGMIPQRRDSCQVRSVKG